MGKLDKMSFTILSKELPNSPTFGHLSKQILHSGREYSGRLYTESQLRTHLDQYCEKWIATNLDSRNEAWDAFASSKFNKKDRSYSYTLAIISSLWKLKDHSHELLFYFKVLNEPTISVDILAKLYRAKYYLIQLSGHSKASQFDTDKIFMDPKRDLIAVCDKFYPETKNLALELVHFMKTEKSRGVSLKKTNKVQSDMILNSLKNNKPSIIFILNFLLDVELKNVKIKHDFKL